MMSPVGPNLDGQAVEHPLPGGVSATFVHPCLDCGRTVYAVGSVEQPHDCEPPVDVRHGRAVAWWAGYEAAREARPVTPLPAHDDPPDEAVEAGSWAETFELGRVGYEVAEAVLRAALPSLRVSIEARQQDSLTAMLTAQREWSEATFGPGPRLRGVLDHISKELGEIEANPTDAAEWIDVAILAFDGAWRAGHSPEQIVEALLAKYAKNRARTWPDWRTADPDKAIEHLREDGGQQ